MAEYSDIPLIAVRENDSVLSVDRKRLGMTDVVEVDSYLEAAGVIVALRRGLALDSLRRPLRGAVRVEMPPRPREG